MKKIYLAALTLAMTACVSNDDLNPVDNYGYIDVNVSNDPVMVTRADVNDLEGWTVTATKDATDYTEHTFSLGTNHVPAGTYVITAKSHADEATANTTNSWGEAYYTGRSEVTITAGGTGNANIECGKAKNSRIKVNFGLQGNQFSEYKINLAQDTKSLEINSSNSENKAYFSAKNVTFVFSYKFGDSDEVKTISSSITCVEGNEHQINITSDTNGTITMAITYDDSFTDGDDKTLQFNAATGEQVTE